MLTEVATVVLVDFQRATCLRATRQVRVVVGRQRSQAVLEFAVGFQVAQGFAAAFDEGIDQWRVVAAADHLFQITAHLFSGQAMPGSPGLVGIVQPHCTTGNRRRTTEGLGLFTNNTLRPRQLAVTAAANPAAPLPRTITS